MKMFSDLDKQRLFFSFYLSFWIFFILLPKVVEQLGLFTDHFAY
jgi:hypothetical protein